MQHQRCRDHRCRSLGAKPKSAVDSEVCVPALMTLEAGTWVPFLGMVLPALTPRLEPERPVGLVICPPVKERSRGFGSETPGRWRPVSDKISEPPGSGMYIREPVAWWQRLINPGLCVHTNPCTCTHASRMYIIHFRNKSKFYRD